MFFIIIEVNGNLIFNHSGMKALFEGIQIKDINEYMEELLKDLGDSGRNLKKIILHNNLNFEAANKNYLSIFYSNSESFERLKIQSSIFFELIDKWKKLNFKLDYDLIIKFSGDDFEIEEINLLKKEKIINENKDKFYYIEVGKKFLDFIYINYNLKNLYILECLFEDLCVLLEVNDQSDLENIVLGKIGFEVSLNKVQIKVLSNELLKISYFDYRVPEDEDYPSITLSIDSFLNLVNKYNEKIIDVEWKIDFRLRDNYKTTITYYNNIVEYKKELYDVNLTL